MMRSSRRLLVAVAVASAAALGGAAVLPAVDFNLRRIVDVVDFDGDGQVDVLVTPNEGRPLFLIRQVNGSYSPELELSGADSLAFGSDVAGSDFDGDGLVDVAWTNDSGTAIYLAARSPARIPQLAAPTLRASLATGQLNDLTAADLTKDGKADLVATGTAGVYLFPGPISAPSPGAPPVAPLPGSPGNAGKAIVVSAIPEVYVATPAGVVRMFRDTSGTWRFSPALTGPVKDFAVGDTNGDGLPDVVTIEPPSSVTGPMRVLLRLATPSGGLGSPGAIAQGTDLRAVAIGDADGSERPDVLYAQGQASGCTGISNELFLLAGRDGGGFYGAERVGSCLPGSQEYLRLVDLDGKAPDEVVFSGNPAGVRAGVSQVQLSRPNLQVSAPASTSVARGQTLSLRVAVANSGARDASDVTLQLGLPGVLMPVAGGTPSECASADAGLLCRLGGLKSSTSRQLLLGLRAQQAGQFGVSLSARGSEADVNMTDNDLTVAIVVTEPISQGGKQGQDEIVRKGIRERGTAKADLLRGTVYADVLDGRAGPDRIFGYAGRDILTGGLGNDTINAGNGNDTINPGKGNDTIDAGKGNDTIRARDKTRDVVRCGAGTDTVTADRIDALTKCERVSRR